MRGTDGGRPPGADLTEPAPLAPDRTIDLGGGLRGELDRGLTQIERVSLPVYRTPPDKLAIMQLYHELRGDVGFCINGRQFLGNTPTVVAGPATMMRFGVVAMGSLFHTFHLHGHRWILPGPHGTTPDVEQFSPMDTPVSQFEDTRTIGPANSLVFTIDGTSGSFMRAGGPAPLDSHGEWHMHCHVLEHMMNGMMEVKGRSANLGWFSYTP
jgi:FtsP/CotA-like multicopper oxidase with cupredoxin domain